MTTRFLITLCLSLAACSLFAQQESQYSAFMYNQLYYNPATAGSRGMPTVTALLRQQWAGFEGAPASQMISFDAPLVSDQVGFGFQINHATKGLIDNLYAAMSYNYKLKLSDVHSLRLGLQGSLQRWGVDFSDDRVVLQTQDDQSIDFNNTFSTWEGNVGFGALFQFDRYFNIGVAIPQIYNSRISVDEGKGSDGATVAQHIYAHADALIDLGSNIAFKPAILFKYVQGAPMDVDINLGLVYNNLVMGGIGYRTGGDGRGESLDLLLFFQVNEKLGIGGAYDVGISDLSRSTAGSFEVFTRFDFGSERDDLVNPRFF